MARGEGSGGLVVGGDGCVYLRLPGSLAGGRVWGNERWLHIPQEQGGRGWEQCVVGGVRGRPRPGS